MKISVVQMERCTLVRIEGSIDETSAPELGHQLRLLTDAGYKNIIVNLKGVIRISSLGIRELNAAWKACLAWDLGDLRLAEAKGEVYKSFERTGLFEQYMHFDTEAEAIASF